MRYKLLVCVFVLLVATPARTQEFSPIVIETGKPVPSTVKSGEPFKITYRAKFFDTVLIYEEQMRPDSLALDKIEVTGLEIAKERVSNDTLGFVNVWEFTYTFRIIQPKKDTYEIPSFNFIWAEKRAGVTKEETQEKEKPKEMPTEKVGVNYVSSIVKPPPLDIRDTINFVSPIANGAVWRRWAYGVAGVASLWVMIIVFRFARYSKTSQSQETGQEVDAETAEDEVVVSMEPVLSPKQARKRFLKNLGKVRADNRLDLTKSLRFFVRPLLLAELRGTIRASMSANEIYIKLSGLDAKHKNQVGWKYAIMLELARRLKGYQEDIDSGRCSVNLVKEIVCLREAVSGLKFHKRVLSFVKRLTGTGR